MLQLVQLKATRGQDNFFFEFNSHDDLLDCIVAGDIKHLSEDVFSVKGMGLYYLQDALN